MFVCYGGSDDKRLFQITRLKPPAEFYVPLEAFYLSPQKLQGVKTLARQSGEFQTTRRLPKKSINRHRV
jgi:hypothetical protein